MSLKERLIKQLLDIGKKHRILVYPTLALVAIISAVSHMTIWARGNGRRLVASVLVMTMLVTQSFMLTSSADDFENDVELATDSDAGEEEDDTEEEQIPDSLEDSIVVSYYRVDENGVSTSAPVHYETVNVNEQGYFVFALPGAQTLATWAFGDANQESYFTFTDFYSDSACTAFVPKSGPNGQIAQADIGDATSYNVFFKATRTAYPIIITDKDNGTTLSTQSVAATVGDINPLLPYTVLTAADYNLYAFGYQFTGFNYSGGSYPSGNQIDIAPSEDEARNNYYVNLISEWKGMNFNVTFDAISDADEAYIDLIGSSQTMQIEYTYGQDVTLPDNSYMDGWAGQEGYYLAYWVDQNGNRLPQEGSTTVNSTLLAENMSQSNITDNPNIIGSTLTAVWKYKTVRLKALATSNCSYADDVITATYGDTITADIGAEYALDGSSSDSFTLSISEADKNKLG